MKSYLLVIFLCILCSYIGKAQGNWPYEKTFEGYSDYMSENYGIQCLAPKKSVNLNEYFVVQPIHCEIRTCEYAL